MAISHKENDLKPNSTIGKLPISSSTGLKRSRSHESVLQSLISIDASLELAKKEDSKVCRISVPLMYS